LIWHAGGALDYVVSQTRNPSYLAMIPDDVRPAMIAYLDAYPFWSTIGWSTLGWATLGWAVGVWGAVLGSILILMRSRHAVTMLWLSMIGFLANAANTFLLSYTTLAMLADTNNKLFALAIFVVLLPVLAYAGRQRALCRLS